MYVLLKLSDQPLERQRNIREHMVIRDSEVIERESLSALFTTIGGTRT
jgi:hypothetical protein